MVNNTHLHWPASLEPRATSIMKRVIAAMLIVAGVFGDFSLLTSHFSIPAAHAATGINRVINYQGKVSSNAGSAVTNGTYNMRFKLFDAPTGGNILWSEPWTNATTRVTMTGGLFSVGLGTHVTMTGSVNFNSDNLYLQVEFDPGNDGTFEETFAPRRRFGSVVYAHNADTIDGIDSTEFLHKNQANTMTGSLTVNNTNGNAITVRGALSGAIIHASTNLSTSGSLTVKGNVQFKSFTGCVLIATDAQGNLSCSSTPAVSTGTIVAIGDSRYVNTSGDTMTGALTINVTNGTIGTVGLNVKNTISGAVIRAQKTLASSGGLVWEGAASGASLYVASSIQGAGLADCDIGATSKLLWDSSTGRFFCGSDQTGNAAVYLQDSFTDSNGTSLSSHTMDVGPGWTIVSGSFEIQNAGARDTFDGGSPIAVSDAGSSDGVASVTVLPWTGNNSAGLIGRYVDSNNYWMVSTNTPANNAVLYEVTGGSLTNRADISYSFDSGTPYTLKLVFDGTSIEVYIDNTLQATYTSSTHQSATRFGLRSFHDTNVGYTATNYDNFSVTSIGDDTSSFFGTGNVLAIGDSRYVRTSGGTMTGALTINVTGGNNATLGLNVLNTISGAVIRAQKSLFSSGGLVWEGSATGRYLNVTNRITAATVIATSVLQTDDDLVVGANAIFDTDTLFVSASLNAVGIGKTNPKAKLDVTGSMSGTLLTLSNIRGCTLRTSSTGAVICGTNGSSFSTGNVLTIGDSRYVNTSGDTMTGNLVMTGASTSPALVLSNNGNAAQLVRNATSNKFTITNSVEGAVPTVYAVSLDGTDDYVSIANNSSLQPTNTISFGAWSQVVGTGTQGGDTGVQIMAKGRQGSDPYESYYYGYDTDADVYYCVVSVGTTQYAAVSTSTFSSLSGWTHIMCVYNNSTLKIYVNGVEEDSENVTGNIAYGLSTNNDLYIGKWGFSGFQRAFRGYVDDARIYSGAISPSEVTSIYNSGQGNSNAVASGLVGWWKFDEGTGTSAADSSGNAFNGTLTSGPTWTSGKVQLSGSLNTIDVLTAENSNGTDSGLVTLGDDTGHTSMQGKYVSFKTNNAERMRLTGSGFGIGTTTPGAALAVSGSMLVFPGNAAGITVDRNVALEVVGMMSGARLHVSGNTTMSGALTARNVIASRTALSGAALRVMAGSTSYMLGSVAIGTTTAAGKLTVYDGGTGAANSEILTLQTTYTSNSAQKGLMWRDATNVTGQIDTRFDGTRVNMVFGHLYNGGYQTSDLMTLYGNGNLGLGTTMPRVKFEAMGTISGSALIVSRNSVFSASGTIFSATGATVFNEQSRNVDFRIEGDTNASLFYLDASADAIGIGKNNPKATLDVAGSISGATLTLSNRRSCTLTTSSTGAVICGTTSVAFSTGNVLTIGDSRYLRRSGGTMTGALTINVTGGNRSTIGLNVLNTISGAVIRAQKTLTSSGELTVEGVLSTDSQLGLLNIAGSLDVSNGALQVEYGTRDVNVEKHIFVGSGINVGSNIFADQYNLVGLGDYANLGEAGFSLDRTTGIIQFFGANVGINTPIGTVQTQFEVNGTMSGAALVISHGSFFSGSGIVFSDSGAVVFNENSRNVDFRIEGDTNQNAFYVDASNNSIGIGTDAPQSALHVYNATAVLRLQDSAADDALTADPAVAFYTASGTRIGFIGDASPSGDLMNVLSDHGEVRITTLDNKPVTFRTNNTVRMTISGAGLIGIGTTRPETELEVIGTVSGSKLSTNQLSIGKSLSSSTPLDIYSRGSALGMNLQFLNDSGYMSFTESLGGAENLALQRGLIGFGDANEYATNQVDDSMFILSTAGALQFGTIDKIGMTLSGSRVGIGTTNPNATLAVSGTVLIGTGSHANTTSNYALTVNAQSAPGLIERIAQFGATDTHGYFEFANGTSGNGGFSPVITGKATSNFPGFFLLANTERDIQTTQNTMVFRGRIESGSLINQIAVGNLLQVQNVNTGVFTIRGSGATRVGTGQPNANTQLDVAGAISGSSLLTLSSYRNCTLKTSSTGMVLCGSDLTGGGAGSNSGTTHLAKMSRVAAQSIPHNTNTNIDFDTEFYDVGDIANISTNRFTISRTGKYLITAYAVTAGAMDAGEGFILYMNKNGVTVNYDVNYSIATDQAIVATVTDTLSLVAGDYIEMAAYQNEGAAVNTSVAHMSVVQVDGTVTNVAFSTGNVLAIGDSRYIRRSGGTMTGALTINVTGGTNNTVGLNVLNLMSGAVVRASKTLASSGTLIWEGIGSGSSLNLAGGNIQWTRSGAIVYNEFGNNVDVRMEGDTNASLFYLDASADFIGIGKNNPKARLDVLGTVSGSLITQNGTGVNVMRGRMLMGTGGMVGMNGYMNIFTDNNFNNPMLRLRTKETSLIDLISITSDNTTTNNLVFRIDAGGNIFMDGSVSGGGADYAEWFASSDDLMPGETVCIDIMRANTVKRCENDADANIMGIVSTNPAFIGNQITGANGLVPPGYELVGLIGQVPTFVNDEGGEIRPGDSLTASSVPGVARRAGSGESTVGVALEGMSGTNGTVNVLISRRNQSMTVEAVEDKVLETIAAMEIEDEVELMISETLGDLNVDEQISTEVTRQLEGMTTQQQTIDAIQSELASLKAELDGLKVDRQQSTVNSGSALNGHLAASTLELDDTLVTGGDARVGGDLHVDGKLTASSLFVPNGLNIEGGIVMQGLLDTTELRVAQNAIIDGAMTINGSLTLGSGAYLNFGSGALSIGDLVVHNSLYVMGEVTIDGLATFMNNVEIKGELIVSDKHAGYAIIPAGGTGVTVHFGSGYTQTPVVTASPDVPVLYGVGKSSATGFTIRLAAPAAEDIIFAWHALSVGNPITTFVLKNEDDMMIFPLDTNNVPVSSSAAWNACIRNIPMMDDSGQPQSCARYHDAYTWTHPDLNISFIWNTSLTPAFLKVPDGYVPTVTESADSVADGINPEEEVIEEETPATDTGSVILEPETETGTTIIEEEASSSAAASSEAASSVPAEEVEEPVTEEPIAEETPVVEPVVETPVTE